MSYSLLLHMEGSGSTFVDVAGHTATGYTGASQTTSAFKFGAQSVYFDATTGYIAFASSPDFDMGSGDWTVDFWMNAPQAQKSYASIFANTTLSPEGTCFRYSTTQSGALKFIFHRLGYGDPLFISTNTYAADTWHHVALIRQGTNLKLYVNGSLDKTTAITAGWTFNFAASSGFNIGRSAWDGTNGYFKGYIDEFRMLKSEAAWTNTFTPPTSAYTWTPPVLYDAKTLGKPTRLARLPTLDASSHNSYAGALYFDTNINKIKKYENTSSAWQDIVADNEVSSSKILLGNNTALRGSKTDTTILDMVKVDASNIITFGTAQYRMNNVAYTFPSGQGGANQFLSNNGSGTLSWTTVASTLAGMYSVAGSNIITTSSTYGSIEIAGTESLKVSATGGTETSLSSLKDTSNTLAKEYYKGILTLTNNASEQLVPVLSFPHLGYRGAIVDYTITENVGVRTGQLRISTDASITDEYTETADVGVTWSSIINGSTVEVKYSTTNLTTNRIMQAKIKLFTSPYSMLAQWLLNESSGPTIYDSSGNNRNGTVLGSVTFSVAPRSGATGTAITTTSTNRIDTGYIMPTTNMTLSFWIRFNSIGVAYGDRVIGIGDSYSSSNAFQLVANTGTESVILIRNSSGTDYSISLGTVPTTGVWYHYSLAVNSSSGIFVYRDGALLGSRTDVFSYGNTANYTLYIGAGRQSVSTNCTFDDVTVYSFPLTATEANTLYTTGAVYRA